MTTAANKALVARYYAEVLNQRDLSVLDEIAAPDFVSRQPDGGSVGLAAYRAAVQASHQAFPDFDVALLDQIAEDERVATRWRARGTHRGSFAGIPATGRPVEITAIHIHRVAGGRLAEHWEELNLLRLLRQLGVAG